MAVAEEIMDFSYCTRDISVSTHYLEEENSTSFIQLTLYIGYICDVFKATDKTIFNLSTSDDACRNTNRIFDSDRVLVRDVLMRKVSR